MESHFNAQGSEPMSDEGVRDWEYGAKAQSNEDVCSRLPVRVLAILRVEDDVSRSYSVDDQR